MEVRSEATSRILLVIGEARSDDLNVSILLLLVAPASSLQPPDLPPRGWGRFQSHVPGAAGVCGRVTPEGL